MHTKVRYHLVQLKDKLQEECTNCKTGCMKCAVEFDLYERYAQAGIPIKYWSLDLEDIDEQTTGTTDVKKYLSKLREAYDKGYGVFACGKNGNGKTLSACAIGKRAIREGYSVRFTFLGEVISAFMDTMYDVDQRKKLKDDILGVDFLILDDIDKAYISENSKYVNSILDSLFRTRVQNCLPVIMTANKPMKDILTSNEEVFSKSLLSLFNESLLPIVFIGPDKRVGIKKELRKQFLDD